MLHWLAQSALLPFPCHPPEIGMISPGCNGGSGSFCTVCGRKTGATAVGHICDWSRYDRLSESINHYALPCTAWLPVPQPSRGNMSQGSPAERSPAPGAPTFQGMMAVNPGRSTWVPPALKLSGPAHRAARVLRYTQSGEREPRKCRATKLGKSGGGGRGWGWGWGGEGSPGGWFGCSAGSAQAPPQSALGNPRSCGPGRTGAGRQHPQHSPSPPGSEPPRWCTLGRVPGSPHRSARLTRTGARRRRRPAPPRWRSARG